MLTKLSINNFVLIENATLDFCTNFNVLSGETGAGKSILIDAVMLLLGERFDKNLIKNGTSSGVVEGFFFINQGAIKNLINNGIDDLSLFGIDLSMGKKSTDQTQEEILISRRFFADGKNEIRINGKQVTASMLKIFSSALIDIYGQHDYRNYIDKNSQLKTLD
ncbi:MAG: AAA family ATPase, partial [Firmicutes bacterium]|nr:AAA family ATPase [Bacillota bacterium]